MKPLEIDMCAGSQLRDTQGEMLSVEGADISEMVAGRGRINDNHGKGFFNCIGKVTAAKKIFKAEDCEDDRQRYYWEKVKSPYVYVKAELFNDEDHPNAKAAAAILRNVHKSDCPLKVKASVEGGVVARGDNDKSLLARTKIHSVALTFVPANQATLVEPLSLNKSTDIEADMILIKSVMHLAQTNVPSFRQITRDASATKVEQNINTIMELMGDNEEFIDLKKALIQESLEVKIAQNVKRIHELVALEKRQLDPNLGITFSHEHHDLGGVGDLTHVKALHPAGHVVGEAVFEHQEDGSLKPADVTVHPEHRRMGLASALYAHGQKITNKPIKASTAQTSMGQALWSGTKGVFKADDGLSDSCGIGACERCDMKECEHRCHGKDKSSKPTEKTGKKTFFKDVLENLKNQKKEKLDKNLTAGYGGTGSPVNMTGGSVLQTESLDIGPKSLSYITCDNCGKEQVYGKFQVKCRECAKAFPMAKLEKFFRIKKG